MMFIEPQIELPPGRSTDPMYLAYDDEWATDYSPGQTLCAHHELGKGHPLMLDVPICTLMFEAGGWFYLWSRIDDELYEILWPTDLAGINSDIKESAVKL